MTGVLVTLLLAAGQPVPGGPAPAVAAATAAVELVPAAVRPGDAFLVRARGAAATPTGQVAGHALQFFAAPAGYAAVGALPVETPPGPLAVEVVSEGVPLPAAALDVAPAAFPQRQLDVERRFVEPPPADVQRRIEEDRAAFARAFAQPAAPPLFDRDFAWPRRARVTAGFGEQRTLNGVKPSQHYGLDLAGAVGAPVSASNAGRVVLVRDCWASGLSVILWHGAGLYTTYYHLSRALVGEGAAVARGERIGLVGRSGRVSGPHLHWSVRVGSLYVDPRSVLRLPLASR